ncbi:MAG TPA: MarR family transcriptional regulator [Sporichthyaceae bacterium]|nr:MarR family transcriptional regulator [Sporichthyaceae bacterium]
MTRKTATARKVYLGENPLELERQVCFALSVASRCIIGVYRPLLEPHQLTHPQYLVMLAMWDAAPRSAKDLAAALHFDPATLSPMLKRLEGLGYLTRERSSADERVLTVDLTHKGRALRAEAEKIPYAVVDRLGMEVEDLMAIQQSLMRVIEATDRMPAAEVDPLA